MLHGRAVIDLHNTKTHRDERIVHDNMLTNWIRDVANPVHIQMLGRPNGETLGRDRIFGGLMMFESPLTNDADDYLFPSFHQNRMIAHADDTAYTGTDLTRGSFNAAQSESNDSSKTVVWDFTQEQGNGNISSLGLCDTVFAICGSGQTYAPGVYNRSAHKYIFGNQRSGLDGNVSAGYRFYDGENGNTVVLIIDGSNFKIKYVPGYWAKFRPLVGGHTTTVTFYEPSTEAYNAYTVDMSSVSASAQTATGFVSNDGKLYVFFGANWASGTTKDMVIFDMLTRTYTTQTITNNTGISLLSAAVVTAQKRSRICIKDGILYVPSTNDTKLVYINLSDNTDCGIVKAPDGVSDLTVADGALFEMGNMIVASNSIYAFTGASSENTYLYTVYKGASLYLGWTHLTMHTHGTTNGVILAAQSMSKIHVAGGGEIGTSTGGYNDAFEELPCLTTKNNLQQAVTKTADMTMRVTYTVTDSAP